MENNDLAELYRIRFSKEELPRKNAIWKVLCRDFIQQYINKSGMIVDVACGYGEFLNNINAERKVAVDLNPDAIKYLDSNVTFYQIKATDLGLIIENKADAIFTSNFLEHLPNKEVLEKFLDQVLIALKPGGRYIILGPNLKFLPGAYWDFYDHHLGLTHLSLSEALELKGFNIDVCIDRFLPYTTQSALPTHPFLVKLYLKMPLFWRFFGKQFFIVASKST